MSSSSPPSVSLRLLGSFAVQVGNEEATLRRKTRALVAYLAATSQAHTRATLTTLFCQEAQNPGRVLRLLLSRIRRRVHPALLAAEGGTVQFNQAAAWLDHAAFVDVLDADLTAQTPDTVAEAVDLYRGEFLDGMTLPDAPEFELWLLGERSRLRRLYERGLSELVSRLLAAEEYERAIPRAQQLLQSSPLMEEAHAHLIWLYARSGRRAAALAQYEQCRDLLAHELAVEPTPELQQLHDDVVAGRVAPAFKSPSIPVVAAEDAPQPGDFVGRHVELALLQQAWEADAGVTVLIEAEAGGGKTRLVQEFSRRTRSGRFLVGRCYESTRALPYHPWMELLQAHLETVDDTALNDLSPLSLDYLLRLLPGLARRLEREMLPTVPTQGGELERLFATVAECLFELPGQDAPPAILFLDDLQWADETSLRLFHAIAQYLTNGMLVGTFRGEEVSAVPTLRPLRDDLRRHPNVTLHHLQLEALALDDIDALTAHLWHRLPVGYRPHVVPMLAQSTGGNPLFLTEVLHELAHTHEVPSQLPVPPSVRDLVRRRLERLPQSGQQVVEALAVLGTPAALSLVRQTSGRSEDETAAAIDLGLRRGLLQADTTERPARYTFTHGLLREAVAGQLSPVRRELLHRRAARALVPAGVEAATLAYHWRMTGDSAQEAHYAFQAGRDAAAVYANNEALRYLQRALDLTGDAAQQITIMQQLGDIWRLTGEWEAAEDILQQALALAQERDDAPERARCQAALGRIKLDQSSYPEALAWLAQARTGYEKQEDKEGLSAVLVEIGHAYSRQARYQQAVQHLERGLQIARGQNNRLTISRALGNIGIVYAQQEKYEQARPYFEQRLQLARELGLRQDEGVVLGHLGAVYRFQFDFVRALDALQRQLAIYDELGDRQGTGIAVGNVGVIYFELGESSRALACYSRQLQTNLDLGSLWSVALAANRIGETLAQVEEDGVAEQWFQRAISLGRTLKIPHHLCLFLSNMARLQLRQSRYTEAVSNNDEALALAQQVGRQDREFSARLDAIRLQVALGQQDVAAATADLEALLAEREEDSDRAALHYAVWQLRQDEVGEQHGAQAAELYGRLAQETHYFLDRRRHTDITGQKLPSPPTLPDVPQGVGTGPGTLDDLLHRVDQLLADRPDTNQSS